MTTWPGEIDLRSDALYLRLTSQTGARRRIEFQNPDFEFLEVHRLRSKPEQPRANRQWESYR